MNLESEVQALRHGVGSRRVVRDGIVLKGPDAASFLQGQCTQEVESLAVGKSADALLLEPQGKLDCFVRVTRMADDEFVLDTESGFGEAAASRLRRFKLRVKAELEETALPCLQLRGAGVAGVAVAGRVVPVSWGQVVGIDVFGDEVAAPDGAVECGPDSWEILRIEAGIPAMGTELDERTIAAEAGLLERCVSFTKGCYTGQELVARLDARGNKVARHLRGLVGRGVGGDGLRAGWTLEHDGHEVGAVTSAVLSPALGWIGLGYVHRSVEPGQTVTAVERAGVSVEVDVRDLPLAG